jgi:hypothetical protein
VTPLFEVEFQCLCAPPPALDYANTDEGHRGVGPPRGHLLIACQKHRTGGSQLGWCVLAPACRTE